MKLKKLGLVLVLIATVALLMSGMIGLAGCNGDSDSNGGTTNGGGVTPPPPTTYTDVVINELVEAYTLGTEDVDKYQNKDIKIVGKVLEIDGLRIVLSIPGEETPVVVVYCASAADVNCVIGQDCEVKGKCIGKGTGVDAGLVKLTGCTTENLGGTQG